MTERKTGIAEELGISGSGAEKMMLDALSALACVADCLDLSENRDLQDAIQQADDAVCAFIKERRGSDAPEAPEWDGESMPDKGARAVIAADGEEVVVMTHGRDNMVCVKDSEGYIGLFHCTELEPIRTPAQRAEDAMFDLFNQHAEITPGKARTLAVWASRAIRDGKIPGVKLEDSQ